MTMFYTDLRPQDSVKIGNIEVLFLAKNGNNTRIAVSAPKDIKIELIKKDHKQQNQ